MFLQVLANIFHWKRQMWASIFVLRLIRFWWNAFNANNSIVYLIHLAVERITIIVSWMICLFFPFLERTFLCKVATNIDESKKMENGWIERRYWNGINEMIIEYIRLICFNAAGRIEKIQLNVHFQWTKWNQWQNLTVSMLSVIVFLYLCLWYHWLSHDSMNIHSVHCGT